LFHLNSDVLLAYLSSSRNINLDFIKFLVENGVQVSDDVLNRARVIKNTVVNVDISEEVLSYLEKHKTAKK